MKLTTQLTVVLSIGLVALAGLVTVLAVYAKWDSEQIMVLVSGSGTVITGLIVAIGVRVQHVQTEKLDQVVQQTNTIADATRQDIGERAAQVVLDAHDQGRIEP